MAKRALTLQDKLAIAMTSAGSMRALAAQIGVTHQKVGRWLRQGEDGGVKQIPAEASRAIGKAFAAHVKVARERAKADRIPFDSSLPLYAERKPLSTGEIGDRVFVTDTQFIRHATREAYFRQRAQTKRFYFGSVRSIVNLKTYFKRVASEEVDKGKFKGFTKAEAAAEIASAWKGRERVERGRIIDTQAPFPLYTRKSPMHAQVVTPRESASNVERQLREKHEPATGAPGTVAADQYLFQLTPPDYAPHIARKQASKQPATRSTRTAKPTRGRGPR